MAVDENGNEIIIQTQPVVAEVPRSQERIKELSDKVELTAKERDELKVSNETTTRERDFYKGYADIIGTQPAAKDHQEEIKAKVLSGLTVQDATYAVLGAAGKLGGTPSGSPQVAGGSATTTVTQTGEKTVSEMNQAERRAVLSENLGWN